MFVVSTLALALLGPATAAEPDWQVVHCTLEGCTTTLPAPEAVAAQLTDDQVASWSDGWQPETIDASLSARLREAMELPSTVAVFSYTGTGADDPLAGVTSRPEPTALVAHELAVKGVVPTRARPDDDVLLRVWIDHTPLKASEHRIDPFHLTALSSATPELTGVRQYADRALLPRCATVGLEPLPLPGDPTVRAPVRCTRLALGDGAFLDGMLALVEEGGEVVKACAVHRIGGQLSPVACDERWAADSHMLAHLVDGMISAGTAPMLVEAWFGHGAQRWVVVNRQVGPSPTHCVAPLPAPGAPLAEGHCTTGDSGGGW